MGNFIKKQHYCQSKNASGFSLVELVVFITIVSVTLAGVIGALSYMVGHSADPLARKQTLAIAESILQEAMQMPFTYCDPDDVNAPTANSAADCTVAQNSVTGPVPNTESRYSATEPLDNVADYAGFSMPDAQCAGICRVGDVTPITGLTGYQVSVSMANVGGAGSFAGVPANDALQITVTVTGPANARVTLTGVRFRYAPRV
ncbi:type IV pilus modification PilV family protein [Methylophilus aquaticus]|uniref:Type II secretion system protein n=1 Tax=Methylophilus aquaticus TaxID=1971610 RepID=A0ABT9JQ07_9PROT|nr:type II secretion system protein [Methylophilus aquaticus]MDP8566640.1 type II secretion system protein [Methylophilus aquaticus]